MKEPPVAARSATVGVLAALAVLAGCSRGERPAPEQVVLVTIDTLRADHLGFGGYPRDTSPFLDALAAESVVFTNAFTSSPHTASSHASMFTGLHPSQHRLLRNGEDLPAGLVTLATAYQRKGYTTAAFTSVRFLSGLDVGFDLFRPTSANRPGEEVLEKARTWIEERQPGEAFFLWIHLFDVHEWMREGRVAPEDLAWLRSQDPEAHWEYLENEHGMVSRGEIPRAEVELSVALYDAQVRYTDRVLGEFFEAVQDSPILTSPLWVITSDHGEGLGNHGLIGHGRFLFEEEIQVPLIVHLPGRPDLARRVEERVRLVDLGPTLAQLAGTSLRGGLLEPEGRSFAALVFGEEGWVEPPVFAQRRPRDEKRRLDGWIEGPVYMLRDERYKVIVEGAEGASLFELARDPNELDDLSEADPRLTEARVRAAREHYEALERQGAALGSGTIRSEHVEELQALGY